MWTRVHVKRQPGPGGSGSDFWDFLGSRYIPLGDPWEILRTVMLNGYSHNSVQL